jgi:hypothetical protein
MLKWIWKLYQVAKGLWADLIRANYLRGMTYSLWKCQPVTPNLMWSRKSNVISNLGPSTGCAMENTLSFGLISGLWQPPLCARFPLMFSCYANPFNIVYDTREVGDAAVAWGICLRRQFCLSRWVGQPMLWDPGAPRILYGGHYILALEASGIYLACSIHVGLTQGANISYFREVWGTRVPPKIKVFL